jgi:hypothetical protein
MWQPIPYSLVVVCFLREIVGAPGFEPGASCSQSKRATGLRYAPQLGL